VVLAIPTTLLAAEDTWVNTIWNKITGMFAVWEVACELERLKAALQDYELDTGGPLPPTTGLDTLVNQGYVDADDIEDPWGNGYRYRLSLDGKGGYLVHLTSAGPDGFHDTDDDLGA